MRRTTTAVLSVSFFLTAPAAAQVEPFQQSGQFAATLGQTFAGPIGEDTASTMVTVTNRDLRDCTAGFFFFQGATTSGNPAVFLNGLNTPSLDLTIPSGGARMVTVTADQLVQGLLDVFVVSPCTPSSLSVSGNYTIQGPNGEVREVFTVRPNTSEQWLRNGRCLVVTTNQNTLGSGLQENLGVATAPVVPGSPVAEGTQLDLIFFDQDGRRIGDSSMPVTEQHSASFPIPEQFQGKLVIVFCLQSPDTSFELDVTPVKLVQENGFQFDNAIFADGFESGDVSAWSDQLP